MSIKKWCIASLTLAVLAAPAILWANDDYERLNAEETLNEVSLESEVEEMEVYDEEERAKTTALRLKEAEKETSQYRSQIKRLEAKKARLKNQIDAQSKRFDNSSEVKQRVEAQAREAEQQRDRLKDKVARLQKDVDRVEQAAIDAKNRKNQARKDLRREERRERILKTRKKEANRLITIYTKQIDRANKRKRTLSRSNRKLERDVMKKESQASRLKQKAKRTM